MRQRLIALGVATICFGLTVGISAARAQTSQSNCKTIEGPGYFAQACGTNAQVSGGLGSSSASTGPEPVATIVPTPIGTFTPVPTVVQPVPVPTPAPPAPRPAPMGLIGALLRLLGLG